MKNSLIIHVDGASRGNPGAAGVGVSCSDQTGTEVLAAGFYTGRQTNNQAEYSALITALALVKEQFPTITHLTVKADSQLLIYQLTGRYKVRHPHIKPLFEQIKKLSSGLIISYHHVPRALNSRADELANKGVDEKLPLPNPIKSLLG